MDPNQVAEHKSEYTTEVKYVPSKSGNVQELHPENGNKSDSIYLYLTILTVQLLIIVSGGVVAWTSPALIKLSSNDTDINPLGRPITPIEVSWVVGLPVLPSLAASLFLPKLADVLGRKRYLQITGLFVLIGGILTAFSHSICSLTISKCIHGASIQALWSVIPIYITEICEDHNRAKFGCFIGVFHQIGHLFCFIVGPVFSLRNFTLIITAPSLIFLFMSFLIPETPFYSLSCGKRYECKQTIKKLRPNKTKKELETEFNKTEDTLKVTSKQNRVNVWSLIKVTEYRVALMLAMLPVLSQILSGIPVIMSYLAPLFNSAGTSLSGDYAAIMVGCTKILCFSFTTFVVERVGRRRMLVISCLGSGVPLFAFGVFFYLKHTNSSLINYLQWLPLVSILSDIVLYSMGLGLIPVAIMNELFPIELRAAASAFIFTTSNIVSFVLMTSYPIVAATIGTHWCLFFYSISCFTTGTLMCLYLPETKGKSLIEIQEILKKY